MCVRTQDKEVLIKAVCIYLGTENREDSIYASDIEGNRWYIGEYSTREKALKVLDEVEEFICNYQLGGVFQMPSDDEVK